MKEIQKKNVYSRNGFHCLKLVLWYALSFESSETEEGALRNVRLCNCVIFVILAFRVVAIPVAKI